MKLSRNEQARIVRSLNIPGLNEYRRDQWWCNCHECGAIGKCGIYWASGLNTYVVHCFKCGKSTNLNSFLWKHYRDSFVAEKVKQYGAQKESKPEAVGDVVQKTELPDVKRVLDQAFSERLIVPIFESGDRAAFDFVDRRKISRETAKEFFYSKNYYELYRRIKELQGEKTDHRPSEDRRVLWFFRDRNNFVVGVQGRALDPAARTRYLTFKIKEDAALFGGIERADLNSRLYVTEGFIDSLFLPNAVSVQGLNANLVNKLLETGATEVVVVFDNEPANDNIKALLHRLAEMTVNDQRVKVCLLPTWLRSKGKDINDYVVSGYSSEELKKIIDDNSFSGLSLKAAMLHWNAKF